MEDGMEAAVNDSYGRFGNLTEEDLERMASCEYIPPPLTDVRMWLVTVFGTAISAIGIVENLLLFFVYASKKQHRNNHNMYLMLLAFFDVFICVAYIALMSINVLSDYLQSPRLVAMWFTYMVPMITISHIAMTSASFLIIAASFERYCLSTTSPYLNWAQRNRKLIAAFAVTMGIISKGTICIEFDITHHEDCAGNMTEWQMQYKPFVFETPYHTVWRFWYRNFVTVFAPFFILAYLNFRIVKALQATSATTTGGLMAQMGGNIAVAQAKRKAVARAATRTLVMVVCCYLGSNIVNVILTIFEYMDKNFLIEEYPSLYVISVDMVSILTAMACAFRLPIYLACQAQLRKELSGIMSNIWKRFCRRRKAFGDDNDKLMSFNSSSTYKTLSTTVHSENDSGFDRDKLQRHSNGDVAKIQLDPPPVGRKYRLPPPEPAHIGWAAPEHTNGSSHLHHNIASSVEDPAYWQGLIMSNGTETLL